MRGRPRDDSAHQAVLSATLDLIAREDTTSLTLEGIAKAAGVSRPTLYRWWSSKSEIILEATLEATAGTVAYGTTGDVIADLKEHARAYGALLSGPLGVAYQAIFAEGLVDPAFMTKVRAQLIGPRRVVTRTFLQAAIDRGALSPVDIELLTDALYAPFFYRLLLGHRQLDDAFADEMIDTVMKSNLPARYQDQLPV